MSLYPIHRGAIRWWMTYVGAESESAALRQMIDLAMRERWGEDWKSRFEDAA